MEKLIYVFQGEAVAEGAANRRPGARHALLALIKAVNIDEALELAFQVVAENGWIHIDFHRAGPVDLRPAEVEDVYLRSALEDAIEFGRATITYTDELPANA